SPMYIPGRLRTASRPFKTLMDSAPYRSAPLVFRAGFALMLTASFLGIFAAAQHTPRRRPKDAKCNLRLAEKCLVFQYVVGTAPTSSAGLDAALLDVVELGPILERREGVRIGAGHPGLAAHGDDLLEQGGPPQGVEVGGDLVEQ